MATQIFAYDWQIPLRSAPQELWGLVADTNRFNRDTGLPPITQILDASDLGPGLRRLRFSLLGQRVEWDEEPFEWLYPYRFSVIRRYITGPLKTMRVVCELTPQTAGGTLLRYRVWAEPRNFLGKIAIPIQIGVISAHAFTRTFQRYDAMLQSGKTPQDLPGAIQLTPGATTRLANALEDLQFRLDAEQQAIFLRIRDLLLQADDLSVQRLRPYQLADLWGTPRRATLETFLQLTRAGLLDLRWELLCPHCRGAAQGYNRLSDLHHQAHCDFCGVDFNANFDRQVEVTFRPSTTIRRLPPRQTFCIAGPQSEPHLKINTTLPAGEHETFATLLETGEHRLRTETDLPPLRILVQPNASPIGESALTSQGWQPDNLVLALQPKLTLLNQTNRPQPIWLERSEWRTDIATAADVTTLQVFRDLFASEALRPGEELEIENLTLLFTDLRDSTRLYRQIGDAFAFARVRQHFELLEESIAKESGAVVKTIGDAVMAVFREPIHAVRAICAAYIALSQLEGSPALAIKAGIHSGACIVVTLNDRLDYFGTTVNIAARLPSLSQGSEIIISEQIARDPQVRAEITQSLIPFTAFIKGFDQPFTLYRLPFS